MEDAMPKKLHHVAYRCKDAKETVDFYTKAMGMKYSLAIAEERVPSTQEECPYFHCFFEMDDGSYLAFFEVPKSPPMTGAAEPNTPVWVQHLALEVADMKELADGKERLEKYGVDVLGPIDHGFCQSIYFFDPSGHRMELTANKWRAGERDRLAKEAAPMLAEWEQKKRAESWVQK
jgi:catechol 2,3-dioxygenase-like lactoylglutathione lyase family enzyme